MFGTNDDVIIDESNLKSYYSKTFFWMFLGLLATGIVAFVTYQTGALITILSNPAFYVGLVIAELAVVIVFGLFFKKCSASTVTLLFFIYAILNGITLASIFYVYDLGSISLIFCVSALLFGACAYLGAKSNVDFSKFSTWFFAILIGGLILSLLNVLIFKSTIVNIAIDWVMLILFFGITAYDMNIAKRAFLSNVEQPEKIQVYAAMQIYLDFINIFLRLLSLFGKNKD